MPNRLSQESSPYLLQHANNPVDWYPWGSEAFEKAQKENKPILVSIGYSTCHWCHVMERESFEDEGVAAYMNAHFVNIKVDREERPDIDQIYMDAVQVLSGSGGWPLNCFLTPDLKPFYGGTYFPPKPAYGRVSWSQLLMGLADSYHNKRSKIDEQANRLMGFIQKADDRFVNELEVGDKPSTWANPVWASNTFHTIMKSADVEEGGFGAAPKFPASMTLNYLLDYHYHTQDESALQQVHLSLRKMIHGGIYDQLGGGFARYSTDAEWLAPHFEKMLYDNALLVSLLSKAFMHTNEKLYEQTIHETLAWMLREMRQEEGGFHTALDADTEGEEGRFYVWTAAEVQELLGDDALIFNSYYNVSPEGNWEGKNILHRRMSLEKLAEKIGWPVAELQAKMERWKTRLLLEREKRQRPSLDDKVLLDWNALTCTAFCDAYRATGKEEYLQVAKDNIRFIYGKMRNGDGCYHSYKDGQAQHPAFLNDYAYLAQALIQLYQTCFEECYLMEARRVVDYTIQHFKDKDSPTFYYTTEGQADILVRKRDLHDNALPSGNAVMVGNLQQLAVLLGNESYKELAQTMMLALSDSIGKYPRSFSQWACHYLNEAYPIQETAVVGRAAFPTAQTINKYHIPNKIIMAALEGNEVYPLLANRGGEGTFIYLCSNFMCQKPVTTIGEYLHQVHAAQ